MKAHGELVIETKSLLAKCAPGSWAKAIAITLVCLVCLIIPIVVVDTIALFYLYAFDRDPKKWTNLNVYYTRPKIGAVTVEPAVLGSLIVRGADGVRYARHYDVALADIKPSYLHDCILAAEDKRFYRHTGTDYFGLLGALLNYFVNGSRLRGASTVSNQLIGEVILADRSRKGLRAYWRKIEEIILTNAAERHFSKEHLLVAYFNNVPVGHVNGVALIGLSAAGEALFGKRNPKTLILSEACVLAGMLHKPNYYLPDALKGEYRRIKERRLVILERLANNFPERYPRQLIERTKKEDIRIFKSNNGKPDFETRRLINYASQEQETRKPGLRVYLTMDADLQHAAENAVNEELAIFDRGPYGFYNQLSYRHALKEGRMVNEEESKLQAALVALDAKTGEVLALVGGRNSVGEFNRATQAKRAPGSVIKPFVYMYGINSGFFNGQPFRADIIIDPNNSPVAQRYTTGGAARARVQLARSDNGAAIAAIHGFGIDGVRDFIAKVTGTNPIASELLAIGAGKGIELSPLQLAAAYTILPNNGVKISPRSLRAVYDGENEIETHEPNATRVVGAGAPFIVTRMLQSVVGDGPDGQHGTAKIARKLSGLESVELAAKTGTGDNDLWFVGFTARVVVVVWVGFDINSPTFEASKGFTGSRLPLQIWVRFMKDLKKSRPNLLEGSFTMPLGVRALTIDPIAGCTSKNGIKEYYLIDRLPPVCY